MEKKNKITGLIMILVFASLVICPALARKFDTMMVGADRWIDNSPNQKIAEQSGEVACYEGDNGEPNVPRFSKGYDEQEEIIYYDGEVEPNLVVLLYYPQEHPEHPNEIINESDLEPNMAMLIDQLAEHPEHPNDVSPDSIEQKLVLAHLQAEHPEEPNEISHEEDLDPNDIKKIILDEGTANMRKEDRILPKLS